MYAIYEIWDTGASVPGGSTRSRHATKAEAETELAACVAAEQARQAEPIMSVASADAAIKESYGGYLLDGIAGQDAREKLRRRAKHAYKIIEEGA